MSEPKRLHPIVIVLTIGKRIKDFIFSFIALFFISNKDDGGKLLLFGAAAIAIIGIILVSIVSWLRYTYRLEENEIRIEYGVFVRKKRYIPLERIQSLDISEGLLQRLCGMVKVQIETAGGSGNDEAEAVLSAISKEEARYIQEYVAGAKNSSVQSEQAVREELSQIVYKITPSQLILLSLTSGGVGVVLSAVLAFLSQLDDFIPYEKIFRGIEQWAVSNLILIALLIFAGLLVAWILALFGTMLKYANFHVTKTEHDLVISQGLLEKRQITIPLTRIQAIRINENIVRQWLGYGSVSVESAGGSASNKEGSKVLLLPLVRLRDIQPILGPFLTDYQFTSSFTPVPKRAVNRYVFRSWIILVPLVVISIVFLKVWGILSLIILTLVTIWGVLKYKDAGWRLEEQQLSLRYRSMVRTTVFIKKNKIQSLELKESYFQRRKSLATLEAFVKVGFGGAGGRVIDMDRMDVKKVYTWFSRDSQKGD
ncbi:PH domain-containing protein [Neobacillus sp. DY30]|uniref:PH domain-containing protein n=1 Tax=Neobacillus sp. DY30 TaxID=3047871 RepID=UPI0024C0E035|nr:PH domain-containing protein [Neobacillus sp. DY30]WHY00961.1 PH domain-containing protein [Neobacillus sp. DY30]